MYVLIEIPDDYDAEGTVRVNDEFDSTYVEVDIDEYDDLDDLVESHGVSMVEDDEDDEDDDE